MGICDTELADGTICTKETVWSDLCEDCLRDYEERLYSMMDKPKHSHTTGKLIIVGEQFGNQTFHGPFFDDDHINQWIGQFVGNQMYVIVPIHCP